MCLEIDELYITFGLLEENGQKPQYIYNAYISKHMTILDLKEKIC